MRQPVIYEAHAEPLTAIMEPQVVLIEVEIDWTRERIIREIEETFPEDPSTALAIAKCESGLVADIQSKHILHYGQERSFGIFQIHAPDWHHKAMQLGYEDYQTDPGDNIAMARYIYEQAGKRWTPWSCYNKRMI